MTSRVPPREGRQALVFFGLAFAGSWLVWGAGILAAYGLAPALLPPRSVQHVGSFAPSAVALLLALRLGGGRTGADLLRSAARTRVPARAWLWVLPVPCAALLGWAAAWLLQPGSRAAIQPPILADPWYPLVAVGSVLVLGGPLAEELGWRGFALPRLLCGFSPLLSSVGLGAVWALWHVPLFFLPGATQYGVGFAGYLLMTVVTSFFMTVAFMESRGSVFVAIVAHTLQNVFYGFFPLFGSRLGTLVFAGILLPLVAVVIVVRRKTLLRPPAAAAATVQPARSPASGLAPEASPLPYFALALGLMALLSVPGVLLQGRLPRAVVLVLVYGGCLSPAAASLFLALRAPSRAFRADFLRRIVDFRRIPVRWYLFIGLFFPSATLVGALVDRLAGGSGLALEAAARLAVQPLMIVPTIGFWLLFGPLPEELGWRGYAVFGLRCRLNPLAASLVVGLAWLAWHLPLFFLQGSWQAEHLGLGTPAFWVWAGSLLAEAVLYTWLFEATSSSTLAAILFHFVGNATGELFGLSARGETARALFVALAAFLVVAFWWSRDLASPRAQPSMPARA